MPAKRCHLTDKSHKPGKENHDDLGGQVGLVAESRVKAKRPSLYQVLLINDDYTPMDFVIEVLEKFFHKDHAEATKIMLSVHNDGRGLCGLFPREIAETKVALVNDYAKRNQHPLQSTMEQL